MDAKESGWNETANWQWTEFVTWLTGFLPRKEHALIAAAPTMLSLLRELEWTPFPTKEYDAFCPCCDRPAMNDGGPRIHNPDCRLSKLLEGFK